MQRCSLRNATKCYQNKDSIAVLKMWKSLISSKKSSVTTPESSSTSCCITDSERVYHIILFAVFGVILFLIYWLLCDPLWRLKFGVGDPAEVLEEQCCRRRIEEEAAIKLERLQQAIHRETRSKQRMCRSRGKVKATRSKGGKAKPKCRPKATPNDNTLSEDPPKPTSRGWMPFIRTPKEEEPQNENVTNTSSK